MRMRALPACMYVHYVYAWYKRSGVESLELE